MSTSKVYQTLNAKLESTLASYTKELSRIEENRSKAAAKLEKASAERSEAMNAGDLERSRKIKVTVSDLESDIETYDTMINKLNAQKDAELKELAHVISTEVRKEESRQHGKDVEEIVKVARSIINLLDLMEDNLQVGNDLVKRAKVEAGLQVQDDSYSSYLNGMDGRRLLSELYKSAKNIIGLTQGEQVYLRNANDVIDKWL